MSGVLLEFFHWGSVFLLTIPLILIAIPLVTYGFTFLNRFQFWTQIAWVVLQAVPLIAIAAAGLMSVNEWTGFRGRHGAFDGSFNLMLFGAAAAVVFALVPQNAEQVDFLRFLPRRRAGNHAAWWTAVICAGPGWIVPGILSGTAGVYGAARVFFQASSHPGIQPS